MPMPAMMLRWMLCVSSCSGLCVLLLVFRFGGFLSLKLEIRNVVRTAILKCYDVIHDVVVPLRPTDPRSPKDFLLLRCGDVAFRAIGGVPMMRNMCGVVASASVRRVVATTSQAVVAKQEHNTQKCRDQFHGFAVSI